MAAQATMSARGAAAKRRENFEWLFDEHVLAVTTYAVRHAAPVRSMTLVARR